MTGRVRAVAVGVAGTAAAAAIVGMALPAAAAPAGPGPVWGTEHFQVMSTGTSPTSTISPVIAYGLFTAAGTDVQHSSSTDTFYFHGGSFLVSHAPIKSTERQSFNPKTCFFSYSERGTFKVSHGAGRYWGIGGGGTYSLSVIGIGAKLRNGSCNPSQTAAAAAQQQEIQASGWLSLP